MFNGLLSQYSVSVVPLAMFCKVLSPVTISYNQERTNLYFVRIWPPDGVLSMKCKFGHQAAPLGLVQMLVIRWRRLHKLQILSQGWVTCIAKLSWIALLALSVWFELHLYQPDSHQFSLHNPIRIQRLDPRYFGHKFPEKLQHIFPKRGPAGEGRVGWIKDHSESFLQKFIHFADKRTLLCYFKSFSVLILRPCHNHKKILGV